MPSLKKKLEIFMAGTFVAENGETYSFSEADVKASAAAYNPEVFKAPIVIGHPKMEDPAYGWIQSVSFSETDGKLVALPDQVDVQFAELVNEGKFPKISTSFYPPHHPSNPVPGVYYIRHVGFLGAKAPAVKGLKTASFAADDEADLITLNFGEGEQESRWALARFMRSMRDFIIEKFGSDAADKVVPDYVVSTAEDAERAGRPEYNFSEPEGKTVGTENNQNATVDFAEREAALQTREQAIADREKKIADEAAARRLGECANFVEGLVKEGKVLPVEKEKLVNFMASIGDEATIDFSEGDGTKTENQAEFFRNFLSAIPARVDFSERTRDHKDDTTIDFSDPSQLATAATAYQTEQAKLGREVSVTQAVNHVKKRST